MRRARAVVVGALLLFGAAACCAPRTPPATTTTTSPYPPNACIGRDADGDWIVTTPPNCYTGPDVPPS